jgi:hypothetical protein
LTDVPAIALSHLNATQRRALLIADNQLALNASWNDELLQQELSGLYNEQFPLTYSDSTRMRWLSCWLQLSRRLE